MNTSRITDSTALETLTPVIDRFLKQTLTRKRYKHSVRVARLCREICTRYGLDPAAGNFAGLAHDLAREWRDEDLVELAATDGQPFSDLERARPLLLHGRAAALFLSGRFGVDNENVLDAIRHHTFGRAGYPDLGKALFLSDYLEPGRKYSTAALREAVLGRSLDGAVAAVIEDAIAKGKSLAEATRAMYDEVSENRG
ncbi:bis(5'-nucleosyl)-tetraphosphatase (symmetrical) YqeK [Salinispira pacifica]